MSEKVGNWTSTKPTKRNGQIIQSTWGREETKIVGQFIYLWFFFLESTEPILMKLSTYISRFNGASVKTQSFIKQLLFKIVIRK